ncbi:MAG: hypothetical protein R3A79_20410 [Nannocystaceae bacterium]
MAAAWAPTRDAAAPQPAPLVGGALLVFSAADSLDTPGQSQSQSPGGGQSQSQSRQSQRQALPDDDDDLDIDDDPFFADEPPPAVVAPAPVIVADPVEEVVEIEVPEGYEVEYEIIEEGAAPVAPAQPAPAPVQPAPAPQVYAPAPVPAAPPMPPVPPPSVAPAMTTVDLHAERAAPIERYDRAIGVWVPVCVAPCRARVPAGSTLRVRADRRHDLARSGRYRLDSDRERVALDVRAGSRQKRAAGIGLAILSATGVGTGLMMVRNTTHYSDPARRSYEGYIVMGMAAVTMIAGVGMALSSKSRLRERKAKGRVAMLPMGVAF